jgi:cephalosporin hydroxylase
MAGDEAVRMTGSPPRSQGEDPGSGRLLGGEISEAFFRLYGESRVWMNTKWLGTNVAKWPLDLWVYQEILYRTRPDVIIETGTWFGGSALFLASICDILSSGRVMTVDIEEREGRPRHDRITYLTGSSVAPEVVAEVKGRIASEERVMVLLDSDHSKEHVLAELSAYAPLVSEGCYLIVEDTGVGLVDPDFGPGPAEAVEQFLAQDPSFTIDRDCEKFFVTVQPGGYLKRRSGGR